MYIEDGAISSDEELSGGDEVAAEDGKQRCEEDRDLKDRLQRKFGSRISSLKLEFSKKKKKGKLPREARQALLDWWNTHYKWPYPTVSKPKCSYKTLPLQFQVFTWVNMFITGR